MLIFKILTDDQYADLERLGEIPGAPIDVADGFVHLSTAAQLPGTLAKHFAGQDDLWLLTLQADMLSDALEWEPARGGDLFPHLYGAIRMTDVIEVRRIGTGPDGRHILPGDLG